MIGVGRSCEPRQENISLYMCMQQLHDLNHSSHMSSCWSHYPGQVPSVFQTSSSIPKISFMFSHPKSIKAQVVGLRAFEQNENCPIAVTWHSLFPVPPISMEFCVFATNVSHLHWISPLPVLELEMLHFGRSCPMSLVLPIAKFPFLQLPRGWLVLPAFISNAARRKAVTILAFVTLSLQIF